RASPSVTFHPYSPRKGWNKNGHIEAALALTRRSHGAPRQGTGSPTRLRLRRNADADRRNTRAGTLADALAPRARITGRPGRRESRDSLRPPRRRAETPDSSIRTVPRGQLGSRDD